MSRIVMAITSIRLFRTSLQETVAALHKRPNKPERKDEQRERREGEIKAVKLSSWRN
jgi:hypothetical protein